MRKRVYDATSRRRRAGDTRSAIVVAARGLFLSEGFTTTTIAAIARAAGCSAPTVYAMFGSKHAILAAIIDAASFGDRYAQLVAEVQDEGDPAERLYLVARISATIYAAERAELDLLRGAGVISPEAALNERMRESMRFDRQQPVIDFLADTGSLRPGLDPQRAREILWALTSRDLFRLLIAERKWSVATYEGWLGTLLTRELLRHPSS